jgi:hypothetical protein
MKSRDESWRKAAQENQENPKRHHKKMQQEKGGMKTEK